MELARPELAPDPELGRAAMESLQREVARAATFRDGITFDPAAVTAGTDADSEQAMLGADDSPVVVGIDQAFRGEVALSAAVALRDGRVVERAAAREPVGMPYVPGLLSFREAPAIVAALEALSAEPDLLLLDGSGRIHFRQAGIATHVGVLFDVPAVGVAKNLLCGRPRESLADPLPEGARVAVEADDDVERVAASEDGDWPVIGHAYQSRQYPNPERRHVNPLYVSPGHRVGAATAVDLVERLCAGYKLPEPTRLADAHADDAFGE